MAATPETPIPAPVTNFPNIKCVSYTDSDDWSSCILSGITLPGTTGYSYSCWVYSSNYAYRATMVILSIYEAPPSRAASQVMLSGVTSQLLLREASADIDLDPTPLPINVWNHICATSTSTTSSGGTVTLYVNGVSVASGPGFTFAAIIEDIAVSTETAGPRSAFYGKVDEVAIWDAPLTAAQVSTLYNGGRSSNINNIASSNLKIWWRMGGGKDADPSGYPHDGGAIYNDALGYEGDNTLVLAMDEYDLPSIVDDGPPSYDRFQVTTPENSGTGLIPRVLNQNSVTFDGINQSYSSPIGAGPDFTVSGIGMTLNCNVKLNSTPSGTRAIFGQANVDAGGTYTAFFIYMSGTTLAAYAADSASGDAVGMGIANLSNDIWYTVTVTLYPGGNMVGYIWGNQYGTPVAISAGFGATWSANRCWSIGAWRWGVGANPPLADFADIQIDECTVFNLASNQNSIRLYNSKLYYRPDWSTPPVDYMIAFEDKLGYPLAWWRMGDTAGDSETKMFDATKFANAYSVDLDGIDDYVKSEEIPHTELEGATSVSLWLKIITSDRYSTCLWLGTTYTGSTRLRYSVYQIYTGTGVGQWRCLDGSGDTALQDFTLTTPTPTPGWHHIVVTDTSTAVSAGVCKFYIDGAEVHEFDPAIQWAPAPTLTQHFMVSYGRHPSYFDGNTDECAMWERVLSPSEVSELYDNGPTDLSTLSGGGPTHWWRMGDDISGTICPDQGSGTALDMELYNGAAIDGDVPSADANNTLTGSGLSASDIQDEIPIMYFGDVSQNSVGGPYFAPPTIITPIQVPYANPVPLLTSSSPPSGTIDGGTTITITGTNLNGVISVVVGGVFCTSPTSVSATSITAVTSANTAGVKDIVVTTVGGHGTLSNAFTYAFNIMSTDLDGIDDYVKSEEIPHTELEGATSVSLWLKIITSDRTSTCLWLGTTYTGSSRLRYALYQVATGTGTGEWDLTDGSGDTSLQGFRLTTPTPTPGWHHIVVTDTSTAVSAGVCKFYIDGAEVHEFDPAIQWAPAPTLTQHFMVSYGRHPSYFDGNTDECAMWERVLSPSEVSELYDNGPTDLSTLSGGGPTHWWRMGDDISGTICPDQGSGTALDMELYNGATTSTDVPT